MISIDLTIEIKSTIDGLFKEFKKNDYTKEEKLLLLSGLRTTFLLEDNPDIFAMLSNINNIYGYKIIDQVITKPRGTPVDASSEFIEKINNKKNIFSCSYYYLRELKNLESIKYWDNYIFKTNYINIVDYKIMLEKNILIPFNSINGIKENSKIITIDQLYDKFEDNNVFIRYSWKEKYRESGIGLINLIEDLKSLESKKNICSNCIRICFFFYEYN